MAAAVAWIAIPGKSTPSIRAQSPTLMSRSAESKVNPMTPMWPPHGSPTSKIIFVMSSWPSRSCHIAAR